MTLAAAPGDQRVKQALDIDAVGLHPPRPAVDLKFSITRHLDAMVQQPGQPEAVRSRPRSTASPPASDP